MALTPSEIGDWAAAYIEAAASPDYAKEDYPLWWAIERFMVGVMSEAAEAEDCWMAILEVLSRNPADHVLGVLAAGPMEDLREHHGPEFIERIERLARRDPAFRSLLRGVWKSRTPEIWQRVEKAQGYHAA